MEGVSHVTLCVLCLLSSGYLPLLNHMQDKVSCSQLIDQRFECEGEWLPVSAVHVTDSRPWKAWDEKEVNEWMEC